MNDIVVIVEEMDVASLDILKANLIAFIPKINFGLTYFFGFATQREFNIVIYNFCPCLEIFKRFI